MKTKLISISLVAAMVSTAFALCAHTVQPYRTSIGGTMTSCVPAASTYVPWNTVKPSITCTQDNWQDGGCSVWATNPTHCYVGTANMKIDHYMGYYDTTWTVGHGNVYSNPRCMNMFQVTVSKNYGYYGAPCKPEVVGSTGGGFGPG